MNINVNRYKQVQPHEYREHELDAQSGASRRCALPGTATWPSSSEGVHRQAAGARSVSLDSQCRTAKLTRQGQAAFG